MVSPKKGPWPTEIEAAALRGRQRQRAWIVWKVFHEDTVLNLSIIMDVFFAIPLISSFLGSRWVFVLILYPTTSFSSGWKKNLRKIHHESRSSLRSPWIYHNSICLFAGGVYHLGIFIWGIDCFLMATDEPYRTI